MPKGKEFYEEIEKPFDQELIKGLCEDIQDGRAFCILQVDNEVHDQILEGFSEFYPFKRQCVKSVVIVYYRTT